MVRAPDNGRLAMTSFSAAKKTVMHKENFAQSRSISGANKGRITLLNQVICNLSGKIAIPPLTVCRMQSPDFNNYRVKVVTLTVLTDNTNTSAESGIGYPNDPNA